MERRDILETYKAILESSDPNIYTQPIIKNPFQRPGARSNSVYVGDTAFGDSGKGIVTAESNRLFVERAGIVYSLRFNGGSNAGHHMIIDGQEFLANQLPTAVAQKNAIALITRGMVFHPGDAVMEIERTKKSFNGEMPGTLLIDERTPLCLDTHRVLDTANGSTARGIGPAYEDFIARRDVTVRDLMSDHWGTLIGSHYDAKKAIIETVLKDRIKALDLAGAEAMQVKRLDNTLTALGTKTDFLDKLSEQRCYLSSFVTSEMHDLLETVWQNENVPVTIEEAQGPGLDPYFGIRPDVSSSRPTSRNVHDGTWGVIYGEDIALRLGVTKTTYMSSVGARWLPGEMSATEVSRFQEEYGEKGKTTGRLRGIYHLSLPFIIPLKRFANYDYLVATHIDAAKADTPIKFVTHFTDPNSGQVVDYVPYQDMINGLEANYLELPGWDGKATQKAKTPQQLEGNARKTLAFLSRTVAPVIMARNGPNLGDNIRWW